VFGAREAPPAPGGGGVNGMDVVVVRAGFDRMRGYCDPRGHDLLDVLEELCVAVVESHVTVRAAVIELQHQQRAREAELRLTT
jgi:hypothetical protein